MRNCFCIILFFNLSQYICILEFAFIYFLILSKACIYKLYFIIIARSTNIGFHIKHQTNLFINLYANYLFIIVFYFYSLGSMLWHNYNIIIYNNLIITRFLKPSLLLGKHTNRYRDLEVSNIRLYNFCRNKENSTLENEKQITVQTYMHFRYVIYWFRNCKNKKWV